MLSRVRKNSWNMLFFFFFELLIKAKWQYLPIKLCICSSYSRFCPRFRRKGSGCVSVFFSAKSFPFSKPAQVLENEKTEMMYCWLMHNILQAWSIMRELPCSFFRSQTSLLIYLDMTDDELEKRSLRDRW